METIKEEKKADLEQLLRNLILGGWKPFGECTAYDKRNGFFHPGCGWVYRTFRELVSKESGLWQFVCENGMVEEQKEEKLIEIYDNLRGRTETVYDDEKYEYRVIESSLKDESELEDFLLSNIKVEGQ